MSKVKIILVAVVLILALGTFLGINMYRNRMVWNEEGVPGNTSGNLLNGGLFCEGDGRIYFNNPSDDGNLYSMDMSLGDFKKIYNDRAEEINFAGNHLVYSRRNFEKDSINGELFVFNTKGLYTLQLTTKQTKCLYDGTLGVVGLLGNDIFYQSYTDEDGMDLYSVRLDGSEKELKTKEPVNPSAIYNGKIYYGADTKSGLYAYDVATGQESVVNGNNLYGCLLAGNSIYAMDLMNGYTIVRMDLDGQNMETVVDEMCSVFNVSDDGDYIYYQVDDGKQARLECKNLNSGEVTVIREGNYNRIHLVGQYIFFSKFDLDSFFVTTVNNLSQVSAFTPPKLDD